MVIDAFWLFGRVCRALIGAFCTSPKNVSINAVRDWWCDFRNAGQTSYYSYQGYIYASDYKSKMDLLIKEAEKLRKEVCGIEMDLSLDFAFLKVEEA